MKRQSRMDNPEKQKTQDDDKQNKTSQHNICCTLLYTNKYKKRK